MKKAIFHLTCEDLCKGRKKRKAFAKDVRNNFADADMLPNLKKEFESVVTHNGTDSTRPYITVRNNGRKFIITPADSEGVLYIIHPINYLSKTF